MRKILCISDSFKGSMTSHQINQTVKEELLTLMPELTVETIDVADGGEGSVDAFLSALGGKRISVNVNGPRFKSMDSFYGILPNQTAVIEMAACAGLPLVKDEPNPGNTTTFGVGELMLDAYEKGCRSLILGLGGSSTNDGGCGAAAALGIRFIDSSGNSFIPTGDTLLNIDKIDMSQKHPLLESMSIVTMCDIDNPLYGPNGAAYVFSPQKGADPKSVIRLDQGLRHLAGLIQRDLKIDVSELPGGGAAGGMGAGMAAFFGSQLKSGIEILLDTVNFDEKLKDCDLVITGEGSFDAQSLRGKVPIGIAKRALKYDVPVICLTGNIGENIEDAYAMGITAILSTNTKPMTLDEAKQDAPYHVRQTASQLARILRMEKSRGL